MVTPQDKANELYGRYLTGYLQITDVLTARVKSKECVHCLCDNMIDEIITFGNKNTDHSLYTIAFWYEVKNETEKISI